MDFLHDLHSDDMILLGSISLISGFVFGYLARFLYSGARGRNA